MPTIASSNPPEFQQYVAAFRAIDNLTDSHLQMLRVHYLTYERTITAKQFSQAMGYSHHATINRMYGRLARLVGERLGYSPEPEKLGTLVTFEKRKGEWHWILRPEVAQALETLGWVTAKNEQIELSKQRQQVEVQGYFDATNLEDARHRVIASIVQRQGQAEFRRKLLRAYDYECPITRCNAEPALEAAHIIPYKGSETNHITNGLPLRADIHTLFDLHLLSIQPKTYEIVLASELMTTSYKEFAGKKLSFPKDKVATPDQAALSKHYELFLQKSGSSYQPPNTSLERNRGLSYRL